MLNRNTKEVFMEIKKESAVHSKAAPTEAQLSAINAQAKAELSKEQVYVFSLRLCDDQVDRDCERFDTAALPVLAHCCRWSWQLRSSRNAVPTARVCTSWLWAGKQRFPSC